jgi:hypothetical protein
MTRQLTKYAWIVPAALSVAFFAYTVVAIVHEGPFGFLEVHSQSRWGYQVMIDLFSAAAVAVFLLVPLSRAQQMRVGLYVPLVLATGSIGLFAWAARLMYLRHNTATTEQRVLKSPAIATV